jgi:putative ABC transport system permease protein
MDNITKNNQTGHHVSDDTNAANNIISQLFASTLGTKALTRSWWRRWVYPVLFLITLTLSLATYLTLDSIQQAVNTYITDNQQSRVASASNRASAQLA